MERTQKIIRVGLLVISFTGVAMIAAPTVYASCGGIETNVLNCNAGTSNNSIWAIVRLVLDILSIGVGIVAVGGIAYGAFLYTSAGGDNTQVAKAKSQIRNTIFGLVGYVSLYAFAGFLIPGGFTTIIDNPPPIARRPDPAKNPKPDPPKQNNPDTVKTSDIKIKNFRDASATTNGNVLKKGVLYRSAQLHNVGDKQRDKLSKLLGSQALIMDVRTQEQARDAPDKNIKGANNVNIPIQGFLDTAPAVNDQARRRQFGKVLKRMANSRGPVLVHCFAGKDRTGWTVAMIMYVSGANDAQVYKEYAESTKAWPAHKPAWIKSGVSLAKKNYGSVINYLKRGVGLSNKDISKIRKKFKA